MGYQGWQFCHPHDFGQTLAIARSPFRQCQRSEAGPSGIRFFSRRPFPGGYFAQCVRMSPRNMVPKATIILLSGIKFRAVTLQNWAEGWTWDGRRRG
jgi:hypothetical protein